MSLTTGRRLGPYEVVSLLGAGGMGQAYRAHDSKLNRDVALKVLPDTFANDPDRLARFMREAQTLAALNHPNIAQIYGLEESDGVHALVIELVEGTDLSRRIDAGALSLDEALPIAKQIAEALEAAHEQGIIHRDLKPANIKVRADGTVKVLDFGLAKAMEPTLASSPSLSMSPTITTPVHLLHGYGGQATEVGMILGTASYMSPEQARGERADKRVDIWAFGCVLFELLTGRRCFEGNTITDVLAAVVKTEPDWTALPVDVPAPVRRLLGRCLVKDPKQRLHDIADARLDLEDTTDQRDEAPAAPARVTKREKLAWTLVMLALIAAAIAFLALTKRDTSSASAPVYSSIPLKTPPIADAGQFVHLAISPDGSRLVFQQDGTLVMRALNSFATTPIEGTRKAVSPTFSPDGTELAFWDGHIKRVPLSGGPVADLATALVSGGLSWSDDQWIYFSTTLGTDGIWRVPAGGGKPEPVTHVDDAIGDNAHMWPQALPGGSALIYTALGPSGGSDDSRVVIQFLKTGQRRTLVEKAQFGRYLATGHLVYAVNAGVLSAVPFDPIRGELTGKAVPVMSGVGTGVWGGQAFWAASNTGTFVFVKPTTRPEYTFRAVDSAGRDVPAPFDPQTMAKVGFVNHSMRVAPDGWRYLLTGRRPGSSDIWLLDGHTKDVERFTFDPAEDEIGVWSPDGRAIAYSSAQTGTTRRIFIKSVDTGAQPRLLRIWPRHIHVTSWSPDRRWLAAMDYNATTSVDVWAIRVDNNEAIPVAQTRASEVNGRFSPDGKWIAYVSNESGQPEVNVVSFPDLRLRRQISTGGGSVPRWDRRGRALYYLQNGYLVAHEVSSAAEFTKGRATPLFRTAAGDFDVTPDGHFVLQEENQDPPDPLFLITNWFTELKAKLAAR